MNFKHMPELAWEYGYPLALLSMAIVSGVTYWIMKKKMVLTISKVLFRIKKKYKEV